MCAFFKGSGVAGRLRRVQKVKWPLIAEQA